MKKLFVFGELVLAATSTEAFDSRKSNIGNYDSDRIFKVIMKTGQNFIVCQSPRRDFLSLEGKHYKSLTIKCGDLNGIEMADDLFVYSCMEKNEVMKALSKAFGWKNISTIACVYKNFE